MRLVLGLFMAGFAAVTQAATSTDVVAVCAENAANSAVRLCQSSDCMSNCTSTVAQGVLSSFIIVPRHHPIFVCFSSRNQGTVAAMSFIPLAPADANVRYKITSAMAMPVARSCTPLNF